MIPLYDKNRTKHFPIITISIITICIIEYVFQIFIIKNYEMYIYKFAFIPSHIYNFKEFYRYITHIFIHGSIMHIIGNMLFLWVFGDNVEDKFGRIGFIEFYIFAGISAALFQGGASIILGNANIPMIGASGAISGLMGAYLLLYPKAPILTIIPFRLIYVPAWVYIIFWFLIQAFSSYSSIAQEGGVAYFAHIGGFVFGVLYTLIYKKRKKY